MKPNIDLNNPIIKTAINEYFTRAKIALETEQTVEKAVLPIYHLNKKGTKLIQIASGVLVNIKNEYFIFSASHVFDLIGNYILATGSGEGDEVLFLPGDRFSSPKGSTGNHAEDPIDASVYHIKTTLPNKFKAKAITLDDFDIKQNYSTNYMFLSAGFRIKNSNTAGNVIRSKQEAFPSIEIRREDYKTLNLNSEINIALWHEKQGLQDGKWQLNPIPKGFSGGAIIRIEKIYTRNSIEYRQKLVGIITEHRKKSKDIEGVLIGTRINVHLAAINKFLPSLFK